MICAFKGMGVSALALTAGALIYAPPASAQSGSPPPQGGGSFAIDEVVVTAQRRAERAQDVPISVTALSARELERSGLASTEDLSSAIPGLTMSPGAARSFITLRGVGTTAYSTTPAVLVFVDGVYQPFDGGVEFANVQSIELAKGPQGTLFGRNATGGILQVTTKNPLSWQGVDLQIGYANYDTRSGNAYASTKLSDRVAADLSAFYYDQKEGWGTNVLTGIDHYTSKRYGVRSKVVAEIDDTFTATLTGDYRYRSDQVGLSASIPPGLFFYNPLTNTRFTLPSAYDIVSEFPPSSVSREGGLALTLDKRLGAVKLLSLTSYRENEDRFRADFDGTGFPLAQAQRGDDRKAFSQEFQISGEGDRFNWVAGLYYFRMDMDISGIRLAGLAFPAGLAVSSKDQIKASAAYAQGTYEILPDTRLTLGARYTVEKREITGRVANGAGAIIPETAGTQEATFKEPNYRVALDHRFSPEVLAYASWTRGFNAGFYNQTPFRGFTAAANALVEPEIIDAYEFGVKSDLFDGRARVNLAAFFYDYKNLQQQIFSPAGITVLNAAAAKIKGIDAEIVLRPMASLLLSFSANVLDAEYKSYPEAANYDILPNGAFVAVGARDAKGKKVVNAPDFDLQASATHTLDTSIGSFNTTISANYQSKQFSDPQNEFPIKKRTLLNLSEQWTSNDEKTTVTLWAKNLTDEVYDLSYTLLAPTGPLGNPGAPRTFGVTLGQKF